MEAPPQPGFGRKTPTGEIEEVEWVTCIILTRDFNTMSLAYNWLNSGQHPFRSVVVDSLTELQKRAIDQTSGIEQPNQQDWGTVLRVMEDQIRKLRDLLYHPTRPLECVMLIALTHFRDGKFRPLVKGQLALTLPGFIDVVGYLYVATDPDGNLNRQMLIAPLGDLDAKDRTNALTVHYGPTIQNPDLEQMLAVIDANT
jgi:hypothetical protein